MLLHLSRVKLSEKYELETVSHSHLAAIQMQKEMCKLLQCMQKFVHPLGQNG